jgi:hypothetical protein
LQRAVFFYVGKHFCIRGGEEQRKLSPSQFIRYSDPDRYAYIEHGSKNRSGGLSQLNVTNKVVECVALPENRPKCLVYLLDVYLSKLPPFAFEKGILYCRPKVKFPPNDASFWYECAPVGKNKLASMVSEMCAEANIPRKTNHSLRATGATVLFQNSIPEKIIQKTTGHRSIEALRSYETISMEQHKTVSEVMMGCSEENKENVQSESVKCGDKRKKSSQDLDFKHFFSGCHIENITVNMKNE